MVELVLLGALNHLSTYALDWVHIIEGTVLTGAQKSWGDHLNERQKKRHMELALKNAALHSFTSFQTLQERDQYRDILTIIAEPGPHSEMLRSESLRLFTLFDVPNMKELNRIYNQSVRICSLTKQTPPPPLDVSPYLKSLRHYSAELFKDPVFCSQMSKVLQVRAALSIAAST